jgi:hypothetical protein
MVDVITNAFRVVLILILVPLMVVVSVVYPLTLLWILWNHNCRWIAISWKIKRKLAGRRNFSIFRSRFKRRSDILWRIEGPNFIRVAWILVFLHIPLLVVLLLTAIIKTLR